jgi:hypothetical protein
MLDSCPRPGEERTPGLLYPSDLAKFFTGIPIIATATGSNVRYKLVFKPDGTMSREPLSGGGIKGEGTWKFTKDGFCTAYKGSLTNCFRVVSAGDKKWGVMKGTTVIAVWTTLP